MRHRLLLALWLLTDLLIFVGSYVLAYFMRVGWMLSTDLPLQHVVIAALIVAPFFVLVLGTTRTFALTRSQTTVRTLFYIAFSSIVGNAFFVLTFFFLFVSFLSRLLLIEAFIISTVALVVWHCMYEQILRAGLAVNPPQFPTIVIGITRESRKLLRVLRERKSPLWPVGVVDVMGTSEKEIEGVPVLGKLNTLEQSLEKLGVTHVIQCSDLEQSLNLLSLCRNRGITYGLLPSVLGIVERDERIESIEGFAAVMVSPKRSLWQWFAE